jgi:hypothetical protein
MPVCPENLKLFTYLTFSSDVLILDGCAFIFSTAHRDKVSDHATRDLCTLGLHGRAVPVPHIAAPGTPRAFEHAWAAYLQDRTINGQPRTSCCYRPYDNCPLPTIADKLLFILT